MEILEKNSFLYIQEPFAIFGYKIMNLIFEYEDKYY